MHNMHESGGAVVDRRLEPAGLTHMLGPYGPGRRTVLGFSLFLLAGAGAALVAFPYLGTVFIVPIVLLAAEFGVRAGLLAAAASTGMLLASALTTAGAHEDLLGTVLRSLALLFLAWVVGRLSERAARSGRLLEQVIESTSDSISVKDLDGRDLTGQRALARNESRYRALVHGLPGTAVLVFDHDLITEFAAGQALTGGGYDAQNLVGCHVSTMFAKPSASRLEEACEAALAGEERSVDALLACEGSHELSVA